MDGQINPDASKVSLGVDSMSSLKMDQSPLAAASLNPLPCDPVLVAEERHEGVGDTGLGQTWPVQPRPGGPATQDTVSEVPRLRPISPGFIASPTGC